MRPSAVRQLPTAICQLPCLSPFANCHAYPHLDQKIGDLPEILLPSRAGSQSESCISVWNMGRGRQIELPDNASTGFTAAGNP